MKFLASGRGLSETETPSRWSPLVTSGRGFRGESHRLSNSSREEAVESTTRRSSVRERDGEERPEDHHEDETHHDHVARTEPDGRRERKHDDPARDGRRAEAFGRLAVGVPGREQVPAVAVPDEPP